MSERHAESTHVQTLQRELARARQTSHTGIQAVVFDFPELADLIGSISDLIYAADPQTGLTTDGDGRNPIAHTNLSTDGQSTIAGRATKRDRDRLKRWRRNVSNMVISIDHELDPNYKKPPAADKPRCRRKPCSGNGRRQPFGTFYCGYCGHELPKTGRAKTKTETRLTLVEHETT